MAALTPVLATWLIRSNSWLVMSADGVGSQHIHDPSWLVEDVFRLMERYGVAHYIHDMHPLQVPLRVTAPPVYVRFHGDPAHGGDYQRAGLEAWAKRIATWRGQGLDVFIYFNNDVAGYALQNARALKRLLAE